MGKRWRAPKVIWLGRGRGPRRPRHVAGGGRPRRPGSGGRQRPTDSPRPMLWLYTGALAAAVLVLFTNPRHSRENILPVIGPAYRGLRTSWLGRMLGEAGPRLGEAEAWIKTGVPVWGGKAELRARDWSSVFLAGLSDLAGIRLTSLESLLGLELPALAEVSPTPPATGQAPPVPGAPLEETLPGLPGAGGKVWAGLGAKPLVGIYQTHSRESFWPALPAGTPTPYSETWDKTVVQVGWWLAQDLHRDGIPVVQARVDNMADGLLASYQLSYQTAKHLLRWFPSVRVLLDIHRESSASAGPIVIDGLKTARISIVVGSDKLLPNPYAHQNQIFAVRLARALEAEAPGILAGGGIDRVPYRYNQQLLAQDVILEIGSVQSTLSEERYAAGYAAAALAHLLSSEGEAGSAYSSPAGPGQPAPRVGNRSGARAVLR